MPQAIHLVYDYIRQDQLVLVKGEERIRVMDEHAGIKDKGPPDTRRLHRVAPICRPQASGEHRACRDIGCDVPCPGVSCPDATSCRDGCPRPQQ